jgi:hypothetical protein
VNVAPTPQADKGRYAFQFPLRPGQTQLQVTYHLNYSGKTTIDPHLIYPLEHFVVIIPKSITFTPIVTGIYQTQTSPKQPDAIAAIASNAKPGQKLSFDISGEGMLQGQDQEASAGGTGEARPGGGLGTPIEAPDPLDKYRGYILAFFGVILVGGAAFIVIRARSVKVTGATPAAASHAAGFGTAVASGASGHSTMSASPPSGANHSSMLLLGLKEELFQLELEHKQGKISDEDYSKTKAALDQTLARAIKRSS